MHVSLVVVDNGKQLLNVTLPEVSEITVRMKSDVSNIIYAHWFTCLQIMVALLADVVVIGDISTNTLHNANRRILLANWIGLGIIVSCGC